ncbi:MAG: DUF885 domain-containing protein [Alphaproteobacteria bacterium]|nr:DUF885 domain-containing protein [Alphaproteobacteria bacterium]
MALSVSLAACQQPGTTDTAQSTPAEQTQGVSAGEMSRETAEASSAFAALIADYEAFRLETSTFARARSGDMEAMGAWDDVSRENQATQRLQRAEFLERLRTIDPETLSQHDRVSYTVLEYLLSFAVEMAAFDTSRIPFLSDSGFHFSPTFAARSARPRTIEEGGAYIRRLEGVPGFFEQNLVWLREGMETGFTQPRIIVDGTIAQLEGLSNPDTLRSILLAPIENMPEALDADERARLLAEANTAIDEAVLPAYQALLSFFRDEYHPASRDSIGISEVPGGREYYQSLVRYHTTLDTSPEEIHQRGLNEVARIRSEMEEVIAETGFEGTFAEFLDFLRTDPQFYAESAEELMMHAAWIAKRADDQMPRFFGQLPRLPYGVRPVPDTMAPTYTTGRYWPGNLDRGVAGGYMVNTYNLRQRPLYVLPALTVHEAVPGHHHQGALAQELENVPDFRRNTYITAFGEGWALYTENLAIDMGLYRTPYENFGRLTYEMWRACRLVVDTGMHYFGWTREEAEACLLENSALAPHNVRTEILRYIGWPGQALAYKPGELLIRDLRREAEERLGANFDIRDFHDTLLADGAMPLTALEAKMRQWMDEQEAAAAVE